MPKNDFTRKMKDFGAFKKLPRKWEIWAKYLLPKALKSCTKSKKSTIWSHCLAQWWIIFQWSCSLGWVRFPRGAL